MRLFKKRQYAVIKVPADEIKMPNNDSEPNIPTGLWVKCDGCGKILYKRDLEANNKSCLECGYNFRLSARERILSICDEGTFIETNSTFTTKNNLEFYKYKEKLNESIEKSGLNKAVITGIGLINGIKTVVCVMDSNFMMGSMGTVVGEKITLAIEEATKKQLPIIIFTASGGARMQEGILSLMQMAKISSALAKYNESGLLYITVLTDPTMGGVTASFAMLGDIILAESDAVIGFAGRRVIEGTIKEKLPDNFQKSEFLLEHGFVDKVVCRREMKSILTKILKIHNY